MSRINTNVNSLIAQRILGQQNLSLNKSLERLSTGYRINRGSDDPAGLIASEKLRSEKASLAAAIGNAERAEQLALSLVQTVRVGAEAIHRVGHQLRLRLLRRLRRSSGATIGSSPGQCSVASRR